MRLARSRIESQQLRLDCEAECQSNAGLPGAQPDDDGTLVDRARLDRPKADDGEQ